MSFASFTSSQRILDVVPSIVWIRAQGSPETLTRSDLVCAEINPMLISSYALASYLSR